MINEIIENIYIKNDSNDWLEEVMIETREGHLYDVRPDGFKEINRIDLKADFILYEDLNLKGIQIVDVGSDLASILMELSNKTYLCFQINGFEDAAYYLDIYDGKEYNKIKMSFDDDYQKLNLDSSYAIPTSKSVSLTLFNRIKLSILKFLKLNIT